MDARAAQDAPFTYGDAPPIRAPDEPQVAQEDANEDMAPAKEEAEGDQNQNAGGNPGNAAGATGSPPLQSLTMPAMLSSDARRLGLQKEDEELLYNSNGTT